METLAQFSIRTTELLFSKDNRTSFTKKEVVEAILCGGGWVSSIENKEDITLNDVAYCPVCGFDILEEEYEDD